MNIKIVTFEQLEINFNSKTHRYRSSDGTCNNLNYPKQGSSETPFGNFYQQNFHDGVVTFRKSFTTNNDLPEPRPMVNEFIDKCRNTKGIRENSPNMGSIMYGQFITHDVSLQTPPQLKRGGPGLLCCTRDGKDILPPELLHPACVPIKIPPNDRTLPNRGCMNFIRTEAIVSNDCELSTRLSINQQTSFMDLSNVYGPDESTTLKLRSFKGGLLNLDKHRVFGKDDNGDYIYGDIRISQTAVLAIIHSIYMRQHNSYAKTIKELNPEWDDEKIFQEARRFTIATHQWIVESEWIPDFQG